MKNLSTSWAEVSLGEICEFKYGKSLPELKRTGGNIPVFGSNGIIGQHNEAITDGSTIVIGRKGSLGEVNFSNVSCWPIDTTYYIDKSATDTDLKWLAYQLSGLGLTKLNKAAAVPGLNREDAYRQRLLLPPLEEQKRIAEVLDRAEELRSKRREAIAQLDTLTQAIFLEMFGDPVTNAMGWEIKPFGKLVINKDSKRKPVKEEYRTKQEKIYPYYGAIGIIDYVDNFLFDGTNLLIEEDGMNLVTRNKPIALIAQGKYWVNNHAHVVCEKEKINLNYLCHYLNYQDISNFVTGIDQKKLNRTNLDKIPVYLPPLPLQQEFARRAEAVEKLKAAHRASLSELDALFASLQNRAFRGEL